jgi:hypothetical protein
MSRQPLWAVSAKEARVHASILAAVLWGLAAVMLLRPGPLDGLGKVKGADFVHFYTLADAGLRGDSAILYDRAALHRRQTELVPASAGDEFVPIYPPQTALLMSPLARLPYGTAALAWAAFTALVFAFAVRVALADWPPGPERSLAAIAAIAFPPFWNLVLHGQSTAFPLAGFAIALASFRRGRSFLAGLALSLLAIKPQFAPVVAVLALWNGQGMLIAGGLVGVALQVAVTGAVLGWRVWNDYALALWNSAAATDLLEPRPYQLHSIKALTRLLPGPLDLVVWLVAAAVVAVVAARVWRRDAPLDVRFGVLILACVLASPHLTVYDATVLAMPLLSLGRWFETDGGPTGARAHWALTYWLYPVLLIPTALFAGVQASVILMAILFWRSARKVLNG